MRERPGTHGLPSDRDGMLSLHKKHGSWSAVARALKIPRQTVSNHVERLGLMGGVDHSVARVRLSPDNQWVADRAEFCRRLQKHGSPNALAETEGIGHDTARRWTRRHGLSPEDWVPDPADFGVKRFDRPLILEGDWAIAADFQVPFTDRKMVQLLCKVGQAWGIQNLLIAGDFIDLHHFAKFDPLDEPPDWEHSKRLATLTLRTLSEAFPGQKVWSVGNHELRITRLTKGRWTIGELAAALDVSDVRAIQSPLVQISTPRGIWDVIHPKSFSVVPTAVGKDLAHKSRHHVITAHGHGVGYRRDHSGESECVDLGCMCDPGTLAWTHLFPTRYPNMRQGFVLMRKGHVYLIQPDSDIDFWVRAGHEAKS